MVVNGLDPEKVTEVGKEGSPKSEAEADPEGDKFTTRPEMEVLSRPMVKVTSPNPSGRDGVLTEIEMMGVSSTIVWVTVEGDPTT
jgi:hypothetical protein